MICTIIANNDKWTTVLEGKIIGSSKHIDYSVFHWKAKDVGALKQPIRSFVFVNAANEVFELLLTADMKERGQNYKTSPREPVNTLMDIELAVVTEAIKLVRGISTPPHASKPVLAVNPGDASEPAATEPESADSPTVILSAEGAAHGLEAILNQAPVVQGDEAQEDPAQPGEPEDPAATVKPSRSQNKKKRR